MFIINDQINIQISHIHLENVFCADQIKLLISFICAIYFVFDQSFSILVKIFHYERS